MSKNLEQLSKFLSYVLRHQPQSIGLTLDSEGWADIDLLITQAQQHNKILNRELVEQIVQTSDKKRFAISDDGSKIRAVQGHSTTQVQIQHHQKIPPELLYHGTAVRFLDSIKAQGLISRNRHYVHLSSDIETAITVGQRHGKPAVLQVKALVMHEQGFKFYLADNGVWLTEAVPAEFLIFE